MSELHYPWIKIPRYEKIKNKIANRNYLPKPKLHGNNNAIWRTNDGYKVQGRNTYVTEDKDYWGAWAFFNERKDWVNSLYPGYVYYGEFCGPKIQKGTSIQGIDRNIFAIYCIYDIGADYYITRPTTISSLVSPRCKDVYVLPWVRYSFDVAYINSSDKDKILQLQERQERNDNWVEYTFGIRGPGEGLVWYPSEGGIDGIFKTKPERGWNTRNRFSGESG